VLERRQRKLAVAEWKAAIEGAAAKLNPILAVVVIGLIVLDISCYAALELGRWHPPLPEAVAPLPLPPTVARALGTGPP